ncbi:PREDICTED: F-box protein At5g07610-like [Fragaria vesca subsp. vesca]
MERYAFVCYGLAFDPSKSPHYKVVCVTNSCFAYSEFVEREGEHHKIDIYSSETGTWKHLNVPYFPSPYDSHRPYDRKQMAMHFDHRNREGAVYCNDAVHWIRASVSSLAMTRATESGRMEFTRNETDVLHYFDLGQERLLLASSNPHVPLFDVMEMERDYSGWFVKYHVDLNPVSTALPRSNALLILYLSQEQEKDAKEEDFSCILWLHMPGKVMSYNLKNNNFETSVELADEENLHALNEKFSRH